MDLNYEEEVKKLEKRTERTEWFNPGQGKHKVKIVEVGDEYTTEYEGKQIAKRRFTVEVNGQQLNWGISKGKTSASLYGQLMLAGKNIGGLEEKELDLLVKSDGKKRDYSIEQAIMGAQTPSTTTEGRIDNIGQI